MTDQTTTQPLPTTESTTAAPAPRGNARTLVFAGGILVVLVIAAALFVFNRSQAYAFHGGVYSPAQPAPPLDLSDQYGKPFSLDEQRGNVVLVYFGYTTCPDLCPTTLSDFQVVKEELGADAERVRFVLATFDPERDTAARLREYLAFFDPDFIGLRGDEAATTAFKRNYGVAVKRVEYPDSATGYLLDHTALVYAIDPEGQLRLAYPYGTDPALIAEDVRQLLNG